MTKKNFSDFEEKCKDSELIFDGKVLHVYKDTITLPNGKEGFREYVKHIGAVCVIPVTDNGEVICVKQFRYPFHEPLIEIPAGKLDSVDEIPLEAAKRELAEETGAVAEKFIPLGIVDTTPALIDEKIHLYMAEGLTFGQMHPDEGEFLGVELIPLATLLDMVMSGEIRDGKTQIAILKAARIKGI